MTTLALMDVIDKIRENLSKVTEVAGVFIDFSKAFDCVNHTILAQKLEHYGIRGDMLQYRVMIYKIAPKKCLNSLQMTQMASYLNKTTSLQASKFAVAMGAGHRNGHRQTTLRWPKMATVAGQNLGENGQFLRKLWPF